MLAMEAICMKFREMCIKNFFYVINPGCYINVSKCLEEIKMTKICDRFLLKRAYSIMITYSVYTGIWIFVRII